MLIEDEPRRYNVIGFYEFDQRLNEAEHVDEKWISRLKSVFYDLDVTGADKSDMRVKQLDNIVKSTSELMLSLTDGDDQRKKLMSSAIKLARELKK